MGPLMGKGVAVATGDGLGTGEAARAGPDLATVPAGPVAWVAWAALPQAAHRSASSATLVSTLRRTTRPYSTDSTQPLACVLTTYVFWPVEPSAPCAVAR